jgi:tryptophan-rich sensory protein
LGWRLSLADPPYPIVTTPSRIKPALVLVAFLAAAFAAAALGGFATASSVKSWYPSLAKPGWTPPPWLFGPAWTVLYTAMSIAAWRIWRLSSDSAPEHASARASTLRLWWAQLALNAAWSWAFFYFGNPAAGLAVIGALLVLLALLQIRLLRLDRVAAALWAPYLLWVCFAAALNFEIWRLN